MKPLLWLSLAVALALAGCAGAAGPRPSATNPAATTQPVPSPVMVTSAPRSGPPLSAPPVAERSPVPTEDSLELARHVAASDLANRLGVSLDQIEVVIAEPMSWPDASLGCPQPGTSYSQGAVEGYRVMLRHGWRVYLYHAGGDAVPTLCASGEKDGGHDFVPPPGFDE